MIPEGCEPYEKIVRLKKVDMQCPSGLQINFSGDLSPEEKIGFEMTGSISNNKRISF